MWRKFRYYLFLRFLIKEKEQDLWRAQFDLQYFDTVKGDQLREQYENDLRKKRAAAENKPEPDALEIYKIDKEIMEIQALKKVYNKQYTVVKEMPVYLQLIRDTKAKLYTKKKDGNND